MADMQKVINKEQMEKQFHAETGGKLSDIDSLGDLKLSENVSKAVSENIPTGKKVVKKNDKKKNTSIFAGISDQIYGILGSRAAKEVILPSVTIQKKRVRKSLEKEKSKLIHKARKIRKARRFKAATLEEIISQIRYLQELIDNMFSFAAKKITELYKKYYLKVG